MILFVGFFLFLGNFCLAVSGGDIAIGGACGCGVRDAGCGMGWDGDGDWLLFTPIRFVAAVGLWNSRADEFFLSFFLSFLIWKFMKGGREGGDIFVHSFIHNR